MCNSATCDPAGIITEKIDGDDEMMCGCEARPEARRGVDSTWTRVEGRPKQFASCTFERGR